MSLISVNNLSKSYHGNNGISNVTFRMEKGDFIGIVGHNGSGKTTLLNLICGLIKPTRGRIELFGKKTTNIKEISQQIGVVLQYSGLPDMLTVGEFLKLESGLYNIGQTAIQEGLELVKLSSYQNVRISELSEGSKRKLVIMKTLLRKPSLLIMDEPTVGIDPNIRIEIWEYLRNIKQNTDVSAIISTNYLFEVESLCDRLLVLKKGELIKNEYITKLLNTDFNNKVVYVSFSRERVESFDQIVSLIENNKVGLNVKSIFQTKDGIRINLKEHSYKSLLLVLEALIEKEYYISSISFGEKSLEDVLITDY